jgi:hypothetical protein
MASGLPAEGTRRLSLVLGVLGGTTCILAYAVTIIAHGPPYWVGWWVLMLAILVFAVFGGRAMVPICEWVIVGYREPR